MDHISDMRQDTLQRHAADLGASRSRQWGARSRVERTGGQYRELAERRDRPRGLAAFAVEGEPGIGGDLFMLIYSAKDKKVYALNASGRSPHAMTRDYFKHKGLQRIPFQASLLPVSVPGVVDGWDRAQKRFGRMTLGEVLQPAIEAAEHGFAVTENLAGWFSRSHDLLLKTPTTARTLTREGRPFQAGDVIVMRDLAGSLGKIAAGGRMSSISGSSRRRS